LFFKGVHESLRLFVAKILLLRQGFSVNGKKIAAENPTRGTRGTPKLFNKKKMDYAGTHAKIRRAPTRVLFLICCIFHKSFFKGIVLLEFFSFIY
jgi:hypothetical protein